MITLLTWQPTCEGTHYPPGDMVNKVSPAQIDRDGPIGGTFLEYSECDRHAETQPRTPLSPLTSDRSFLASYYHTLELSNDVLYEPVPQGVLRIQHVKVGRSELT